MGLGFHIYMRKSERGVEILDLKGLKVGTECWENTMIS